MVKVFRVQHVESGWGPYASPNRGYTRHFNDNDIERHPTDTEDRKMLEHDVRSLRRMEVWKRLRFGFESMEQLMEWFDHPRRELLASLGYEIAEYEARDVVVGERQLVFNRATARFMRSLGMPPRQEGEEDDIDCVA